MRNLKPSIFFAVLLAALCAYLYFVELPGQEKKERLDAADSQLFSFPESDIERILITRADGTNPITLQQMLGHPQTPWRISEPVETIANTGIAASFAGLLAQLKKVRKIEVSPADFAEFSLSPPSHSIRIILKDNNSDILEIGESGMNGQTLYARVGNTVYLIGNDIQSYLTKTLDDWRRQELFLLFSSDVQSVQIAGMGQDFALMKEGEQWFIQMPASDKGNRKEADSSKVFDFLARLSSLRGESFIDTNKEEQIAAIGDPISQIKISMGAVSLSGKFYNKVDTPGIIFAVTTPAAPLYKISLRDFEGINQPVSYFRMETSASPVN
jgi:hypothetical protein